MLKRGAAAERAIQGATRAAEVITRIRSLINKASPERTEVQLNRLVEETISLAEGQALRNRILVSLELAPDLPVILGDKIQLQQVILNLLMNGIESMADTNDRRPRQLWLRTRLRDDQQVWVSIRDSGVGVREDIMPRLFEPFFTTHSQGIGMGLAISRSIIEAHRGRLWAESSLNQGSVFQFTLPGGGGPAA